MKKHVGVGQEVPVPAPVTTHRSGVCPGDRADQVVDGRGPGVRVPVLDGY